MPSPASLAHFDVTGPDEPALHRFYADTFGWTVNVKGPGYALIDTGDGGPNGAIVDADEPTLTIGLAVDDLPAALDAATAAGGEIVMPAVDNGWVTKAKIQDPAGNVLTLIQR